MFEQSLYNQEAFAPVPDSREGDLFHNYEFKTWNFSPRIYKIIGVSALVNILFLVFVAETNLLTRKGCDSPITSTVCQVIDMAFVADTLFGTDREYADAVYEKTQLKDADVTFVDVSDAEPQLEYPQGYFALANPEQAAMLAQSANPNGGYVSPGPLPDPSKDLLNTTPEIPKANPNAVVGELPSSPLGGTDNAVAGNDRKVRGGRRFPGVKLPANSTETSPQSGNTNSNTSVAVNPTPTPDEAKQDQFGIYINKRPMRNQAQATIEKVTKESLKLDNAFKVMIAGNLGLGADGKTIILKNPKLVPFKQTAPQDPQLEKLVQDWILAVGDAGWFGYLDKLKSKNIIITVEQNDTDLIASIKADQPSENDAKSAASGFNALLGFAIPAAKGDEQEFLKKASTTADGKSFILNFSIPKQQAQDMIQRKLIDATAPTTQPSSTAINKLTGSNQAK